MKVYTFHSPLIEGEVTVQSPQSTGFLGEVLDPLIQKVVISAETTTNKTIRDGFLASAVIEEGFNVTETALVSEIISKLFTVSGVTTASGTIVTTSGSKAVTGTSTAFTKEVRVGDIISTTAGVIIGKVASITDATNLVLVSGAASTNSGISFKPVPEIKINMRFFHKKEIYALN